MGRKVLRAMGEGDHRGKRVGVLGLTFKPDTDDMRDAPSIALIQALQDVGVEVSAYDPEGVEQASKMLNGVNFVNDAYAAAEGADALVIVTEWNAFRALDLTRIAGTMKAPVLVDLRNIYHRRDVEAAGLTYTGIGRG